jgi:hypothetical protein
MCIFVLLVEIPNVRIAITGQDTQRLFAMVGISVETYALGGISVGSGYMY